MCVLQTYVTGPQANSGHRAQASFCGWELCMLGTFGTAAGGLEVSLCDSVGTRSLEACVWFLPSFSWAPFPSASFRVHPVTVTGRTCEYSSSSFRQVILLRTVWGTSDIAPKGAYAYFSPSPTKSLAETSCNEKDAQEWVTAENVPPMLNDQGA